MYNVKEHADKRRNDHKYIFIEENVTNQAGITDNEYILDVYSKGHTKITNKHVGDMYSREII